MPHFHLGYSEKPCQGMGTSGKVHTDHMHGMFATHLELKGALLSMMVILSILTFA